MRTCEACELPAEDPADGVDSETLCEPCARLREGDPSIRVRPLEEADLELVYAWRSNPDMYRYFREQDGPLEWDDHVEWFESRAPRRHDFVIRFDGRRVGVVSLDVDDEVGIYLGDYSARGEGIATAAMGWLCDRFADRAPLYAGIRADNEASQHMVERCGFEAGRRDGEWQRFVYEP